MTINIKNILQEAVSNITLDEDLGNLTVPYCPAKRKMQLDSARKLMV